MSDIYSIAGASEYHVPALLEEVMEYLLTGGGLYVDATLGGGGHSSEILKRCEGATLVGIDRDTEAIAEAGARLAIFTERFHAVHGNYADIKALLAENGFGKAKGILMDLGVSSHQFDDATRGFSFHEDAPLDMRMDLTQAFSAHDLVNEYSEKDIARVIFDYGEDRHARRIAAKICEHRAISPIKTTSQLSDIIKSAYPAREQNLGSHPAKKTFQAIRIEVNGELDIIADTINEAAELLKKGGRLCIISFHSLEDRIVKNTFAELAKDCVCPRDFPICKCDKKSEITIITRKPIIPSDEENGQNSRSHSAKLRVAEKK